MATFIKSASAKNISGSGSVTATFAGGAVTAANNALIALVMYFRYDNFPNEGFAGLTCHDSAGNALFNLIDQEYGNHTGGVQLGMYFLSPCAAGLTGVVASASGGTGQIFVAVHEVAPTGVGKLLYCSGVFPDWATGTQDPTTVIPWATGEYAMVAYAVDNQSYQPDIGSVPSDTHWNAREYCSNTTPLNTGGTTTGGIPFDMYGSLCTWDSTTWPGGGPLVLYPPTTYITVWSSIAYFMGFYSAIPTARIPRVTPPTGSYAGAQTVTITSPDGFDVYYTLDGSTPTTSSTHYTGPITIPHTLTLNAFCHDASGVDADSAIVSDVYTLYTGTCTNPGNIIDGNDTTFADLDTQGTNGDEVAVKATAMSGVLGNPGCLLKIDYEVTQNDLVAPSQTIPAWKVSAFVNGVETVLDSASPGAGVQARTVKTQALAAGTNCGGVVAKIEAACQIVGSSGGVHLKIYGAYVTT